MKSCKVPGDDGLTKKVYETFWYELKTPLLESINLSTLNKTLSISNRQAVIPFIEKKDWQTRYIKIQNQFKMKNRTITSVFLPFLAISCRTCIFSFE